MTDKVDIWMPLYVRDYLGATSRLTTEQHGAYMLLIMDYWLNGPPPDDDAVLAQITRMPIERWQAGVRQALSSHFKVENHQWLHSRIEGEKEKASNKRRRSIAGAAGKWGKDSAAERGRKTRSQRLAEARKKGTHTDDQWEAMKDYHGNVCVRCGADDGIVKDHITPIYQGGSDAIENIQPLCKKCNSSKGPEAEDFRKDGWQNACQTPAKRLLNDSPSPSPSPTPPQSQSKSKTNGSDEPVELAKREPDRAAEIREVFAYWQAELNHPRAKLDDKRRKKIRDRLKDGYSARDLMDAVDGIQKSPHHMGENDRATVYDDIELICRDGPHVDKFIKLSQQGDRTAMGSAARKTATAAERWLKNG